MIWGRKKERVLVKSKGNHLVTILIITMQQEHIPVPPLVNMSIYTAHSKSHTGCYYFQTLHKVSQLCQIWTPEIPTLMLGQQISILSLAVNGLHLLLYIFDLVL